MSGPLGVGRRPLGEAKRSEIVQVRVTPDELERIKATADYHRLTVADLVRKALGL